MAEILALGLEPAVVALPNTDALADLLNVVGVGSLWKPGQDAQADGLLIATPFGFVRVRTIVEFQALLPPVEPVEIVRT